MDMINQSCGWAWWRPDCSEILCLHQPTDLIVSGFLRASRTFEIYRHAMHKLSVKGEYRPLEIPLKNGEPNYDLFYKYMDVSQKNRAIRSIVVSDPYKQVACSVCDSLDSRAEFCMATNLIINQNGKFLGKNIDGEAFLLGAHHVAPTFRPKNAVFFGCGGVSSAVASILAHELTSVTLVEIDPERASTSESLLYKVNPRLKSEILLRPSQGDFYDADFLYNGTGLGKLSHVFGSEKATPLCPNDLFPCIGFSFDANYTPWHSPFLQRLQSKGLSVYNGYSHMLGFVTLHLSEIAEKKIEFNEIRKAAEQRH